MDEQNRFKKVELNNEDHKVKAGVANTIKGIAALAGAVGLGFLGKDKLKPIVKAVAEHVKH